jgi:hypothetical protein
MILLIAATLAWHVTGCDIGNAYLEALTNRDLYMELLPSDYTGYDAEGNIRRIVVRLKKNLYGSKQAALMWYSLISEVLCRRGFRRSKYEPCCYILDPNGGIDDSYVIVCVYVDDLLITGPNVQNVEDIKQYLAESFKKIKDLTEVKKYLVLKIQRVENQIILNQEDYIEDIVIEYGKSRKIKVRGTPLPKDLNEMKEDESERVGPIQDMLGKIRYLADRTRPDIMFPASFLARFAASPNQQHLDAMYQVIGYLKGTKDESLTVGSPSGEVELFAMSDASFVRGSDSKGQLAYYLFLSKDSGSFYCKSQKDKNVSVSSLHAEMNALVEAIKMIIYHRESLKGLHLAQQKPTIVYVDNEGVIAVIKSFGKDNRSIYLINKINFVRECVERNIVKLEFVNSENNVADIGTKSLDVHQHQKLSAKILQGIKSTEG